MLNALKQAVQFGLEQECISPARSRRWSRSRACRPRRAIGAWVMEWYWNQPGVPHVAEFVETVKKRTGRVPTARTWFGYVSVWTCALAAAKAKSLKAVEMAKALQDFELPPEIALGPNPAFYRAGQNQLIATLFVGEAQASGCGAGRPVQGHQGGQRRRCRRHGRGERLQDDVAGLTPQRERAGDCTASGGP